MHAMIELAEFHRQDILADAARYRLADQAAPDQPLVPRCKEALWSAVQSVCASVRAFHAFNSGRKKSAQTTLTLAH
jgi:hypothetical protein